MAKLTCTSCGADYPRDWRRAWGRHPDTHGKGPVMVCSALVPNGLIAPVPDDKDPADYPIEKRTAMQVCGGTLSPAAGEPSAEAPTWHES